MASAAFEHPVELIHAFMQSTQQLFASISQVPAKGRTTCFINVDLLARSDD
jgi:hypothetical protein